MLDVAILVPLQARHSIWGDAELRASVAPPHLSVVRARDRFLEHIGADVEVDEISRQSAHRSLTAIALATSLERAGLSWHAMDPGAIPLQAWRARLKSLRARRPRLIGISTTYIVDAQWIATLCALVREALPESSLAIGGYYYATDAKAFLSLDADIFCIGEGEVRIVAMAKAIRDGHSLDDIPGLYLRGAGRRLRYTGHVEPLPFDELPLPDWSLSKRMDPPIDPAREPIDFPTETQRGCIFKCQYCTFRTLAAPMLGSVEHAVRRIENVAAWGQGAISVVDATATYPRERWRNILRQYVERGGSPVPMGLYARVSDLDDEVCGLMARAGVRQVRIGQESGDQRMLNLMRKGTRVDQVAPAIAALGRHGMKAMLFMIYGFPGEDEESLGASRRLLARINDGHEHSPVVYNVRIGLFDHQDFAGINQRELGDDLHRYNWRGLTISPTRAWQAAVETYLELSRIPHAPYSGFDTVQLIWRLFGTTEVIHHDAAFFRWAKAVDRGVGIFLEEELEGKRANAAELASVRQSVLAGLPSDRRRQSAVRSGLRRLRHRAAWQLIDEWTHERERGVGALTRVALALDTARATGSPRHVLHAIVTGSYPALGFADEPNGAEARAAAAEQLIHFGVETGKRRLPKAS